LTRRTNGCELTHAGEEFLLSAERMEAEMLSIRSSLGDADVSISGSVRIGAPDGFGVSFLAPRLAILTARYPDLKIQLVPVPRSFSLSRREADIAITVDRPDQGRLVAKKLVDYTLCLYASRSYLAEHPAPQNIEDLAKHRLVGYVDDLVISPAFEISSAIGQVEAVKAGAGIGILHTFIAREYSDLVPVLPERTIHRSYWLAYHESVRTLRRITAVSSFISDLVNSETGRFT
jgi:DNA-binding transcriptional LysR family regulator